MRYSPHAAININFERYFASQISGENIRINKNKTITQAHPIAYP